MGKRPAHPKRADLVHERIQRHRGGQPGGLATGWRERHEQVSTTVGLLVLVLFSFASLMSSIRLVAELRNSIANVQRAVDENGMGRMVGAIEPLSGFGARLPLRWLFPIYFGLSTAALVVLCVVQLFR
jgi:hypothetical protein